jgi:hypothetical protein
MSQIYVKPSPIPNRTVGGCPPIADSRLGNELPPRVRDSSLCEPPPREQADDSRMAAGHPAQPRVAWLARILQDIGRSAESAGR